MTGSDLFLEIGNISEEFVAEAENYRGTLAEGFRILKSPVFRKTLTTAACLVVCLGLVMTVQRLGVGEDSAQESTKGENSAMFEMAVQETEAETALQDTVKVEESAVEEMLPEKEESKVVLESAEAKEEAGIGAIPEWDSAVIRERLAEYANDYQTLLAEENAFVIAHGEVQAGRAIWDEFCMHVDAGETAQIDIIRFTIEGDAIIEAVYYDGEVFHLLVDNSRDAYRGSGDAYFEASYKYWQKEEKSLEGGGKSIEYMLTNSGSEYYSIAYIIE